jgi:hypothetical protein
VVSGWYFSGRGCHGIARCAQWLGMSLVVLATVELIVLGWWVLPHATGATQLGCALALLAVLASSVPVVSWMSRADGILRKSRWFPTLVAFNAPLILVVFAWLLVPPLGQVIDTAAAAANPAFLAGVHGLRAAAVGAFGKVKKGELPAHFGWLGAFPDLLFALSAPLLAWLASSGAVSGIGLAAWHGLGISVFLGAGVGMYLTVDSPLKLWDTSPTSADVFRFPLVLAPAATVPYFAVMHLFAVRSALL